MYRIGDLGSRIEGALKTVTDKAMSTHQTPAKQAPRRHGPGKKKAATKKAAGKKVPAKKAAPVRKVVAKKAAPPRVRAPKARESDAAVAAAAQLDDRHRIFAEFVVKGWPRPDAYIEAGFDPADRKTASNCASELMKRSDVRKYVDELRRLAAKRVAIDRAGYIERLEKIVDTPIGDIGPHSWLIKKVKRDGKTGEVVEVESWDKLGALQQLAKTHQWHVDVVETREGLSMEELQKILRESPAVRETLKQVIEEAEAADDDGDH